MQSDYEEGSLFTQVVYFDIYIKYNLKTQQAEITEIRKYNASAPVVRIDNTIFKKATKLTIPAYMAEDVAEENNVEENPSNAKHCKWFNKPICNPCKKQSLWIFTDILYTLKIHFQHHRIYHQPN